MKSRLYESLTNQYANYIAPFLWLHNEDQTKIKQEFIRIHGCGIKAVCLESRTHDEFCKQDWWDDVAFILKTCRELGMKVWILDDKHFPSGYANGAFAERYAHLRIQNITEFHIDVAGPMREGCAMADVWKPEPGDEIVGIVALERRPNSDQYTGKFFDISHNMAHGMVYFDLPAGVFSIVFLIRSCAGSAERDRFFCDKLNPEATDVFIKEVYEPHYTHFQAEFGKTFMGFFSDEPGFMNNTKNKFFTPIGEKFQYYPWHQSILETFREKFGEKALFMLCGIWLDIDGQISSIARTAYMDSITNSYRENFCRRIGTWCAQRNIQYIGHVVEDNNAHTMTGNGAGHYFRAQAGQHMAGVDVVLHQIIPGMTEYSNTGEVCYQQMDPVFFHYVLAKLAASAAQLQPEKRGRAMCEIFGAYGWAEGTKLMKYLTDHMLVRGINYFVPHAFSPKENDTDCPPNFYGSGRNPQFKYFYRLMKYQNRMCHLFSGGAHVPVCALIYDAEARWAAKDYTPLEDIAKILYDQQLDYEIIPFDALENPNLARRYPILILPYTSYLAPENKEKLKRAGIRVITTGREAMEGFEFVPPEGLAAFMEPFRDVWVMPGNRFLRYYHYRHPGLDLYLCSSEDMTQTLDAELQCRDFSGGSYVVYDGFENRAVRKYSKDGRIQLRLAPYNALVVAVGQTEDLAIPDFVEKIIIDEAPLNVCFSVSLCPEEQTLEFRPYKTMERLENITGRDGVPDFSGNIRYEAVFCCQPEEGLLLNLGNVGETASVTVNGKPAGVRLFPPYELDITQLVVAGENRLEVLVSNTSGYRERDGLSKWLLFEPSGLLGPVKLKKYRLAKP